MSLQSTPRRLHEAGFPIGGLPDSICPTCIHVWGEHILHAPGTPIDGGTFTCPDCDCIGTWDADRVTQ